MIYRSKRWECGNFVFVLPPRELDLTKKGFLRRRNWDLNRSLYIALGFATGKLSTSEHRYHFLRLPHGFSTWNWWTESLPGRLEVSVVYCLSAFQLPQSGDWADRKLVSGRRILGISSEPLLCRLEFLGYDTQERRRLWL